MPRLAASDGVSKDEKTDLNSALARPMTGTHFHALDEKGRIIVPAKLRPALTETFYMFLNEDDNIQLCDVTTWLDTLAHQELMTREDPGNEFIAIALERTTSAAELVEIENDNWRVAVPEILQFYAGLQKEVVTVGLLNRAVLWDRAKWEARAEKLGSPEVRAAQAKMLRAAASGWKPKQAAPVAPAEELPSENDAARIGNGTPGTGNAAAASAGDGKRGSRVLTLQNIGR